MFDFTLSKEDFVKACRLMSSVRNNAPEDLVDITCTRDSVRFVVTGREVTCAAEVESLGIAQVPVELFAKLGKVARTYQDARTRIRIEPTRIRVNTMAVAIPELPVKQMGDRMIDIPDDAPLLDLLALSVLFKPHEITESNLTGRVLAANSERLKTLAYAAKILAPLGIRSGALDELQKNAVCEHAERLRAILLPPLISETPN